MSSTTPELSPEYLNESNVTSLLTTCIVFLVLDTLFVVLRFFSRWHQRVKWGWDDTLMLGGWLTCVGLCIDGISKSERVIQGFEDHKLITSANKTSCSKVRCRYAFRKGPCEYAREDSTLGMEWVLCYPNPIQRRCGSSKDVGVASLSTHFHGPIFENMLLYTSRYHRLNHYCEYLRFSVSVQQAYRCVGSHLARSTLQ